MNSEFHARGQDHLREEVLSRLKKIPNEEREQKSKLLSNHLFDWFAEISQKQSHLCLGLFSPLKSEPQIEFFAHKVKSTSRQIELSYPKLVNEKLEFFTSEQFEKSALGFLEPVVSLGQAPASLDIVLVPGVVFHSEGLRIGRGRGYYDRFLSHRKIIKCGICFQDQIHSELWEEQAHDQRMDFVITDKVIFDCSSH